MDEKDYITRFEYDERQKRIDDENNRQNHRLDKLETITDQIAEMAASIKAMVVTMQAMQKEQEEQGKRLTDIEKKPADNWDKLVYSIIAMVATAAVTYILTKGGLCCPLWQSCMPLWARFGGSRMLGKCPLPSWQSTPFLVYACIFPALNIRKRVMLSE